MGLVDALDNLARTPGVPWKGIMESLIIAGSLFDTTLDILEYRVQQRKEPPAAIAEYIKVEKEEFLRSQAYQRAKLRVSIIGGVLETAASVYLLRINAFAKLWYFFQPLVVNYLPPKYFGEGTVSAFTYLALALGSSVISLPLSLYSTFVVEEEFGFNKSTLKLFFTDFVKKLALSAVLLPPILLAIGRIIEASGQHFVLYLGLFVVGLGILAQLLMPTVIMPIFRKYTPLEDGELRTKINALASRLGFPLTNIYVEDGSTRSAHSNAYFIGLPWYKQIVIYDTLLEQQTPDQIVAVLAHELGHWWRYHIPLLMAAGALQSVLMFLPLHLFLNNAAFFHALGFSGNEMPVLGAVALYSDILTPLQLFLTFAVNVFTRSCEFDADRFAVGLGYGKQLAQSLATLGRKNLSALEQHWLYSSYHNSHPRMEERLAAIKEEERKLQ